jgi:hypothetical protein
MSGRAKPEVLSQLSLESRYLCEISDLPWIAPRALGSSSCIDQTFSLSRRREARSTGTFCNPNAVDMQSTAVRLSNASAVQCSRSSSAPRQFWGLGALNGAPLDN